MHVSYFSFRHGDTLNDQFQKLLSSDERFHEIAQDIFLFSTVSFYEREKDVRIKHLLEKKSVLSVTDKAQIEEKIRVEKSITRVNSGDLELMYADSSSERLIQTALSFLVKHSSQIDYIAGLKKAKAMGFEIEVHSDVLEFGVPLKVEF